MASGHWDIVNSNFTLMSSAHIELFFLGWETEHMNSTGGIFLQGEWLHDHEVPTVLWLLNLYKFVYSRSNLEQVWVGLLAYFTFECLPVHADQVIRLLLVHLSVQPVFKALEMDETNTACTLTGHYARILWSRIRSPTETATALLSWIAHLYVILEGDHGLCLFELLLV